MVFRTVLMAGLLAASVGPAHATSKSDVYCLALTAFTEARNQGEHGMALVVHTVMQRMETRNKTACQVVHAPNQYHGVQYWPKGTNPGLRSPVLWQSAMFVADQVVQGKWNFGPCAGAEYFYAPKKVRRVPQWAYSKPFKCEYRGHRFYGET